MQSSSPLFIIYINLTKIPTLTPNAGQYPREGLQDERNCGDARATYAKLEQAVEKGRLEVSPSAYREELKNAANVSDRKYQGTHGLRWS